MWRSKVLGLNETAHPEIPRLAALAEWFIISAWLNQRPRSGSRWLIIAGHPGCGKTHVLKHIRRYLKDYAYDAYVAGHWAEPPRVEARDWGRIAALPEPDYQDAVADLRAADIALLDDLGAETDPFRTGVPDHRLRLLLEDLQHRWTVITTNLPPEAWPSRWDQRLVSRLSAARYFDAFAIPDHRSLTP